MSLLSLKVLGSAPRLAIGVASILALASTLLISGCSRSETSNAGASNTSESAAVATAESDKKGADSVVVYYFHGESRCKTCIAIQKAIQTTVKEKFSAETASGLLTFREVNMDEERNAHFVKDFDLSSSSMVVVLKSGEKRSKWENCPQIWPLAHKEGELAIYAEKQINTYLELVRGS